MSNETSPAQSTWITYRSAEGNIGVREDDKLPPLERRGPTNYQGPFNAKGHDHAMEQARILFAPLKRLMTKKEKADWKAEQSRENTATSEPLAAPLVPLTRDSEEMRMLGTHLNAHVLAFEAHGKKTMVHYLAIGMVLKEAQDRLKHGEYRQWLKKYGPSVHVMTANRYVQVATCLQLKDKSKYNTVLHLLSDAKHDVTPDLAQKISKVVPEVDGKTFKEMGVALKVLKGIKAKRNEKAQNALGDKKESAAARNERLAGEAFKRWKGVSLDFAVVTKHLSSEHHQECIGILTTMLQTITGGKVQVKHD